MYKLVVTELAHEDLDNIVSYIAVQLKSPRAATNFLADVERCYKFLISNPLMYEQCNDPRLRSENYRKVTINNCVLIYKFDESAGAVTVYRFFYGAQNYAYLL
jgi:toxin ParE1/3/4